MVGFDQTPAGRATVDRIPPHEHEVSPPARRLQASTTPIPEDFDPFAPPRIENPLPDSGRVHPSKGASPLGIELGPQPSLDDLYHLQGGSRSEPFGPGHPLSPRSRTEPAARSDLLPDWEKPATVTSGSNLAEVNEPMDLPRMVPDRSTTAPRPTAPEAPHREGITDPLLLFPAGLEKGRSQQQPSPASSQPETAAAKRASRPPAPPPEQTASPPPLVQSAVLLKASKAEVSPAGSAEELLAAFLEGAGVADLDRRTTTQLAFMRLVGQLLREATQGAYELLYARRTTKHELRVGQTVIAPKENNPLKFSPDAEAALRQLLLPPVRGFMTPVEAMRDAFDDLEAHQFGVIAGIRAALSTLLERFDPGELEKQLVSRSIIDSMVPLNRNARLWEVFKERYQRLRDEAEEDFHSIFGRAFVRAYEEQIERLRSKHNEK
jgi:FHA domain-containing protein